jgi:GTP-binding protein HflX
MIVLTDKEHGVLITPVIREGNPSDDCKVSEFLSLEELMKLSFHEIVLPLEEELGKHRKVQQKRPGQMKALLFGVQFSGQQYEGLGGDNLDELERLATTGDLSPQCRLMQKRRAPQPGTFIGNGKVNEARNLVLDKGLDIVVFGCDLPYATLHRLTEAIGVPVIDRSELILSIFASHAMTNEGRLQVKLAQLDHSLHRMLKEEKDLDRQAGGIGVMGGAGETAATLIKRRIHQKRLKLEKKLLIVKEQREEGRLYRSKGSVSSIALAGYTNAGKSTLLNALCGKQEVETADKMFTTLTTTTRKIFLPSRRPVLVSDTVGFVEKLPHHLVAAFESTLAESACASLTLVVIDANVETIPRHKETVDEVLTNLGQSMSRRLPVLTKVDLLSSEQREELRSFFPGAIEISSLTGEGIDELLNVVDALLSRDECEVELLLPFDELHLLDKLYRHGQVLKREWTEDGIRLRARLSEKDAKKMEYFVVN